MFGFDAPPMRSYAACACASAARTLSKSAFAIATSVASGLKRRLYCARAELRLACAAARVLGSGFFKASNAACAESTFACAAARADSVGPCFNLSSAACAASRFACACLSCNSNVAVSNFANGCPACTLSPRFTKISATLPFAKNASAVSLSGSIEPVALTVATNVPNSAVAKSAALYIGRALLALLICVHTKKPIAPIKTIAPMIIIQRRLISPPRMHSSNFPIAAKARAARARQYDSTHV